MPRLVDADWLHEKIAEAQTKLELDSMSNPKYWERVDKKYHKGLAWARKIINEAITIEINSFRPHGRWALREGANPDGWEHHYCTNCSKDAAFWCLMKEEYDEGLDGEWQYIGLRESGIEEILSPCCPNCGAKMDGDLDG